MRSISLKIILVLVIISLTGAIFTSFFIQYRTQSAFADFILDENQVVLTEVLLDYYTAQESWDGVESILKDSSQTGPGQGLAGGQRDPNINRMMFRGPIPFVLANESGEIIAGGSNHAGYQAGDILQSLDLNKGIKLEQDGLTIGWLVVVPFAQPKTNSQQAFLNDVQQGLIISSLITLLIALFLGGILIQSFTKPIRQLAAATEIVAAGELGYQVEIQSKDELGKLSDSFNSMSSDLKRADQRRKQITADIAHDLRTPLSVMTGYTEAMSEGKLEGSQEIYQTIHEQAQHLNYLIDDLRTLSLLDSKELNFQIQNIDPALILKQINTAFSSLADEKGIRLFLQIDQDLPRIDLDPDRLAQILGNLLNNALNVLSEGGEIHVSAMTVDSELQIFVQDDGPGILKEDIPYIFDRLYRSDKSRNLAQGSSGLGLAITKKLIEAQGGKISVDSKPGEGTIFKVSFPIG